MKEIQEFHSSKPELFILGNHYFGKILWVDNEYVISNEKHIHSIVSCIFCYRSIPYCFTSNICMKFNEIENCEVSNASNIDQISQVLYDLKKFYSNLQSKCSCSKKHLSCLNENEWVKRQKGVVQFTYSEDDRKARKFHPAVFPISMAKYFIELFTHQYQVVLDPFGGSGTVAQASLQLSRKVISIDLSKEFSDYSLNRCKKFKLKKNQFCILNGNTKIISRLLKDELVDLIFTSPPYANMLSHKITHRSRHNRGRDQSPRHYTTVSEDLGNKDIEDFLGDFSEIFLTLYDKVKPKGHVVINICNDIYDKNSGEIILFPSRIIQIMKEIGFAYRNKFIWDRTNFFNNANGFGYPSNFLILSGSYEIILDFVKDF